MTSSQAEIDAVVAVLREFSDTEEEMHALVKIFFATADDVLARLQAQCGKDYDRQIWVDAAHKLRGSTGMLKAARLNALAEKAEKMGAAPPADREKICGEIRAAVEDIRTGLQKTPLKKAI